MLGECPICFENKILNKKFKCKHTICDDCFNKQKESKQKLCCCICRSYELLDKNDISLYENNSDDDDSYNEYFLIVSQPFMN